MDSETHDPIDLQTKELKYAFLFYFIQLLNLGQGWD